MNISMAFELKAVEKKIGGKKIMTIKWNKPEGVTIERRPVAMPALFDSFLNPYVSPQRLINDYFADEIITKRKGTMPAVNIMENDNQVKIEFAAPGLNRQDFNVKVEDNILTVSCKKETEKTENKDNVWRREFSYGAFERSFELTDEVNSDHISAVYENGILTVVLQKKEEARKKPARTIEIQ